MSEPIGASVDLWLSHWPEGATYTFTRGQMQTVIDAVRLAATPATEPGLRAAAERAIDLTLGALRNGAVIDHPKSHAREAVIEAAVKYALAATPAAEPGLECDHPVETRQNVGVVVGHPTFVCGACGKSAVEWRVPASEEERG